MWYLQFSTEMYKLFKCLARNISSKFLCEDTFLKWSRKKTFNDSSKSNSANFFFFIDYN